jgi:hypothetical protein
MIDTAHLWAAMFNESWFKVIYMLWTKTNAIYIVKQMYTGLGEIFGSGLAQIYGFLKWLNHVV